MTGSGNGRRIIGAAFVSLDGVMQAPGGPEEDRRGSFPFGGWLAPLGDEALGNQIATVLTPPYDLLLGRATYEIFAAYWPFNQNAPDIAEPFNACRKYVMTRSDLPLDWNNSERVADLDALAAIKAGEGPDIVIQGSSTLYPQLLQRGLIDRLVLMTAPVVLGQGKRLLGDDCGPGTWRLVEQRTGSTGIVMSTYEPSGPVETGGFGEAEASRQEQARRERWQREG
ncbi:dihydrofolate reductase family protein [Sphingomonas turrisvirgatae]|uniref:Riboflavin biosynthesis protein RibD n=1 Tax=Sphingomonas turrisvirgatae TaxID=1888892 RepID=A0A1E3LWC9_9SPHN|nr:dihydrofolate reductase family protein [Sphingomonas turrisvirgatae]ODP37100.1 riboflavin biosynthesis protein RibD [Sphingomonas turrisvirgatae]